MSSKYNDLTSVLQVLGCVYKNPSLLEERDKYPLTDADFADEFHRATFGALFKLYELGAREFNLQQINDFFSTRPKYEAIYKLNKGDEWLLKTAESCTPTAFDYYYQRLKKFSLLRAYDNCGIDVSDIYDVDNILDTKKKQLQEEKLDNATLESIADTIDSKLNQIRIDYVNGTDGHVYDAAEDIEDLVDSLKEHPEVGMPLFGSMFNTVTRGARLRKFYLRSAATGVGKSRSMIADACYIACEKIYNQDFGWINTHGCCAPTLFITTEQDITEIQTMMLAFIADVNEEHILQGKYEGDEEERIKTAIQILKNSKLYVKELPDFSLQDVEDVIKTAIREQGVSYVFKQKMGQ